MRFRSRREAALVREIKAMLLVSIPSGVITVSMGKDVPAASRQKQIVRAAAREAGVRVRMHETMDPPGLRVLILKEGENE